MKRLTEMMTDRGLQGILITDAYSLRYYTGFRGGEGVALCTVNSARSEDAVGEEAGSEAILYVDSRYTEAAGQETEKAGHGFSVREYNHDAPLFDQLRAQLAAAHAEEVGFEDRSMICSTFSKYHKELGVKLVPLEDALLIPRQIKTEQELELLKKAESIGDLAFSHILKFLKPGITELEVAAELEYSMKKNGAEGLSFDTIVASGLHSSMPHAIPTEKKLEKGDFVTMDFGCIYQGYCSDMTRTVVIGKASEEQRKIHHTVLQAQLKAMEGLRPGMRCRDVDKIARDYIRDAGYGEYFGHGLGHSVGLYIHESPALNTRDETFLVPGMIETIEPGIYVPGFGGVRIEDMGVVAESGYRSFAHSPKELIEL
ncbi:MAG: aminopeptidase P family protein [Eubacterium sp.]|nr:aminopeptidase P family protein [Eubacterium sp.]